MSEQKNPFPEKCIASGGTCDTCILVGRRAMQGSLEESGYDPTSAKVLAESYPFRAGLFETNNPHFLSCEVKQDESQSMGGMAAKSFKKR